MKFMYDLTKQAQAIEYATILPAKEGYKLLEGIRYIASADYDESQLEMSLQEIIYND